MSELQSAQEAEGFSMRDVEKMLQDRGVKIAYDALSTLVGTGEISDLLGIVGGRNKRVFPPVAVDILAEFWPVFKENRGTMPQAEKLLRAFLETRRVSSPNDGQIALYTAPTQVREEPSAIEVAEAQGRAQGLALNDTWLTAEQAAELLCVSTRMLRKEVPATYRIGKSATGDRWLKSTLLSLRK